MRKLSSKDYILLPAGNILTFRFGKNRVQDLRQFLKGETFEKVLQDFGIEEKTEVEALEALTLKFSSCIHKTISLNVSDFLTVGQLGYKGWSMGVTHTFVEIPTEEKCAIIVESRYGARTFPMRLHYQSALYTEIMQMSVTERTEQKVYEKLHTTGDYRVSVDGVSLYPSVMALNKFGTGESKYHETGGEQYYTGKRWGYYKITYITNKALRIPILGKQRKGLTWNLYDEFVGGWKARPDIEDAIKYGYVVTFTGECLIWPDTGAIFEEYVKRVFKVKQSSHKDSVTANPALYATTKVILQSLYGKQSQRSMQQESKIMDEDGIADFRKTHSEVVCEPLDNANLVVTGKITGEEKRNFPVQNGIYVLSLARSLMLSFMAIIDPTLTDTELFSYTANDSLRISSQGFRKLEAAGVIGSELGMLEKDMKGLIIREINLAPNRYLVEYLTVEGEIKSKIAGFPKASIGARDRKEYFEKALARIGNVESTDSKQVINTSRERRVTTKLTAKEEREQVPLFSVLEKKGTRVFSDEVWRGWRFDDGYWYAYSPTDSKPEEVKSELVQTVTKFRSIRKNDLS